MNPKLYNAESIERRIESKMIGVAVVDTCPKVSIIIPAYKVSEFIAETLDSVFSQTFTNFEILVVNDGSPDSAKLVEVLGKYLERLIYVKQANGGAAAARNTAIYLSRGEFLAFLDGDDIWEPNYLKKQLEVLSNESLDMIYADAMMFGSKPWAGRRFMELSPSNGEVTLLNLILGECSIITSGTIVKREVVLKSGGFDEDRELSGIEDFDLWTRIAKFGNRIGYQRNVLLRYRVFAGSLSGGFVERAENGVTALKTIKNKLDFDTAEHEAWTYRFKLANAQVNLEKGKVALMKQSFVEARDYLKLANGFFQKSKLTGIIFLLGLCPKLVFLGLKRFRSDEFSFEVGTDEARNDRQNVGI